MSSPKGPRRGIDLRFGDVLRWVDGDGTPRADGLVMFLRWSIPSDNYYRETAWLAVNLLDLDYQFDAGYPEPEPKGTDHWHWELVE